MAYTIRLAKKEDAKQIVLIKNRCRKDWYKWLVDQKYLDSLELTEERIEKVCKRIKEDMVFIVYEEGNEIKGLLYGGEKCNPPSPALYEIYGLYVDIPYQRLWIGKKLFNLFYQTINKQPFYVRTSPKSQGEKFYRKYWGISFWVRFEELEGKPYKEIWYTFNENNSLKFSL